MLTPRPKMGVGAATEDSSDSLRLVVTQKGEVTLQFIMKSHHTGFSQNTLGHLLAKWPFSPHLKQVISSRVLKR